MVNAHFENIAPMKISVGKKQTTVDVKVNAKDDVSQLLSCGATANVISSETLQGEVKYFGRVNLKLLYLDDGGALCGSNYNADFEDVLTVFEATPLSASKFSVSVVDCRADAQGNVISVRLIVETEAQVWSEEPVGAMTQMDDAFVRFGKVDFLSATSGEVGFETSAELSAASSIERVLSSEATVLLSDCNVDEGVMTASGKICLALAYVSEGKARCDRLTFDFSEQAETSLNVSANAVLTAFVKNVKIRLNVVEGETNDVFFAEVQFGVRALCLEEKSAEIVQDAYGADFDVALEKTNVGCSVLLGQRTTEFDVEQLVPESAEGEFAFATALAVVVENCVASEGSAKIDGVARFDALYYDAEGVLRATPLELPFTQVVEGDFFAADCKIFAVGTAISAQAEMGANVSAKATVRLAVCAVKNQTFSVATAFEETPFDKSTSPAVEVAFAQKGETLWNLAKNVHMSEQDLLALNPDLSNPLSEDAKVLIYNKL